MSALPPKADLTPTPRHVGYVPLVDIRVGGWGGKEPGRATYLAS